MVAGILWAACFPSGWAFALRLWKTRGRTQRQGLDTSEYVSLLSKRLWKRKTNSHKPVSIYTPVFNLLSLRQRIWFNTLDKIHRNIYAHRNHKNESI
jgi:hypothetical protein